jgi:hypothetical protein
MNVLFVGDEHFEWLSAVSFEVRSKLISVSGTTEESLMLDMCLKWVSVWERSGSR